MKVNKQVVKSGQNVTTMNGGSKYGLVVTAVWKFAQNVQSSYLDIISKQRVLLFYEIYLF